MSLFCLSHSLLLALALSLHAIVHHVTAAVLSQVPIRPDYYACALELGEGLTTSACINALEKMPISADALLFSPRLETFHSWNVEVPARFFDLPEKPSCVITIQIDGFTITDNTVEVSWNEIRRKTKYVIEQCVSSFNERGGYVTHGLERIAQALINPATINGTEVAQPVAVMNPEGYAVGNPVNVDNGGYNIPAYMIITVSGPGKNITSKNADWRISYHIMQRLQMIYQFTTDAYQQGIIGRSISALNSIGNSLPSSNLRWWDFKLGAITTAPSNVVYECNATLGTLSIADCENALFQFMREGEVILDPLQGPIIETAGECAIAVYADQKVQTTWDLFRSVAEKLVATCVSGPSSSHTGGTAINQAFGGMKRQSQNLYKMSVYLQQPFYGAANATCAFGIVSSHQGDVRTCPAEAPPARPPERTPGQSAIAFSASPASLDPADPTVVPPAPVPDSATTSTSPQETTITLIEDTLEGESNLAHDSNLKTR